MWPLTEGVLGLLFGPSSTLRPRFWYGPPILVSERGDLLYRRFQNRDGPVHIVGFNDQRRYEPDRMWRKRVSHKSELTAGLNDRQCDRLIKLQCHKNPRPIGRPAQWMEAQSVGVLDAFVS